MRTRIVSWLLLLICFCAPAVCAQSDQSASNSGVNMIARTTMAVNYRRGETTHLDLKGTDLMPELTGQAKIINKSGLTDIHVDVANLRPAKGIDLAYLTYVLWTVSPQGPGQKCGRAGGEGREGQLAHDHHLAGFCLSDHCRARLRGSAAK